VVGGGGGGGGRGKCIAKRLSLCFWALLIFTGNAILIGNRLQHSLNGMVECDRHNPIMRVKDGFSRISNFRC
jgi:hypothetical protein